jgi:hypothetical protein
MRRLNAPRIATKPSQHKWAQISAAGNLASAIRAGFKYIPNEGKLNESAQNTHTYRQPSGRRPSAWDLAGVHGQDVPCQHPPARNEGGGGFARKP